MLAKEVKSERGFIAAILNQAMVDALLYKNPRSIDELNEAIRKLPKRIRIKKGMSLIPLMCNDDSALKINYFLVLARKINSILQYKMNKINLEIMCQDAREFFEKDNEIFSNYCHLIDIDPEYLAENAQKHFHQYDSGLAH